MSLLKANTPTAEVTGTGSSQTASYASTGDTGFATVYNSGTEAAKFKSGKADVAITDNVFSAIPPGGKETLGVDYDDTDFAYMGNGVIYVQRGTGE